MNHLLCMPDATNRPAAGNTGPDHPAAAPGWADQWVGSHPAHSGDIEGRAVGERRVTVSRPVPARVAGPHQGDVENDRQESPCKVLRADREGPQATRRRAEHMGALRWRADGHPQLEGKLKCLTPSAPGCGTSSGVMQRLVRWKKN